MGGDAMSGIWAQPLAAQLALASLIMLVLVWMIIWAIRRFGSTQEATPRWRQVRLGVNNQAIIDAHRRLIVVRRDDVEHVLLIGGGNNDLIVERTIVRDWPLERSDGDRLLQIEFDSPSNTVSTPNCGRYSRFSTATRRRALDTLLARYPSLASGRIARRALK